MSKDKKRSSTETARRIWLAGIGAYGRAFTEAQEAIKDVTGKSSEVFDDLVQKGEMIEMVVAEKRKDIVKKADIAVDKAMPDIKMPDLHIDERIRKMRSRLSGSEESRGVSESLEARLSAVEAKLDRVLALLEPKTTVRKAVTKPVSKAKAKPTTRTANAKKPTAKSNATKK